MNISLVKQKVAVIGEGAWGTAIATVLARNGHEVLLWCYDQKNAEHIRRTRFNDRYLPGIELDEAIVPVTDFGSILQCEWIAEAIPTQYLRDVLTRMHRELKGQKSTKWIVLSKGFEQNRFAFPGTIITDIFGSEATYAVVAGPTYAHELARQQVSAAMVACPDSDLSNQAQMLLQSEYFMLYPTDDVIGVQISSALKNVIALALGMLEGAGYGQNTRAFFLTLCFQEIARIAEAFGADRETIYGLAGFGDVILTSYGGLSKNFSVGKKMGSGHSLDNLIKEYGILPEGVNTLNSFYAYAHTHSLRIPIIRSIYEVIHVRKSVSHIIDSLGSSHL